MAKYTAVGNVSGLKGGDLADGQTVDLKDKDAVELVSLGALVPATNKDEVSAEIAVAEMVAEIPQAEMKPE